jgi:folate-dependent phosphoribosylglycinamide formyltransferase PurN
MSNIKTYDDLVAEEKRLQALLYSHKEAIKTSFIATRQSLNPIKAAVNTAKNLFTRSKSNPLMKLGVDFGVDVFFRRFVLAKAGWFTKIVLPFVLKNYSTYIIKERPSVLGKFMGLFKGKKASRLKVVTVRDDAQAPVEMMKETSQENIIDIKDASTDTFK